MKQNKRNKPVSRLPRVARSTGFWARRKPGRHPVEDTVASLSAELGKAREVERVLHAQRATARAERDGLRRELEWVLSAKRRTTTWARFLGRFLRGLLHRRYRFALVPVNDLLPCLDDPFSWDAVGLDPHFSMLPIGGAYPSGWVLLRSKMPHSVEGYNETRLYVDLGQGYRQKLSLRIPVRLSGTILEVVKLPKGVRGLRWDPVDAHGRLRQEPLVMTEVGYAERAYRMVRRVVTALLTTPRDRLDEVSELAEPCP